jgi:hypothetical protein
MRHYVGTWPQSVEDMDVYSSGRDGRLDYLHRPPSLPSIPSANQIYRQPRPPIKSTVRPVSPVSHPISQSDLPSVLLAPSTPSTPSAPSANQIYRPPRQPRQPRFPSANQIYRPRRLPSLPSANQIYRPGPATDFAYPPRFHDATRDVLG